MKFTRINIEDLEFLSEVRNSVSEEFLHDSRTFTLEETLYWFNTIKPDFWIIWKDGVRIGYFRLSNYSKIDKDIYIGADLHENYRGKGLGYFSYMEFMPFLFNEYNLNKITLEVLSTNKPAFNLYKKIGFVVDDIKKDDVLKNGEWVDSIIMSIKKDEFYENL